MGNTSLSQAAHWLLVIGGINWGLVGLGGFLGGNWNVVSLVLGQWPQLEWIVYVLVGLSGVYALGTCTKCSSSGM
jgi:uncharacterized membrane protein YuzA (DUF378 family)